MRKKKIWIAEKLGRNYSVIKREIIRNSGEHLPYTASSAQRIANRNARKTNTRKLEKEENVKLKEYVETSLCEGYSPEQIAGTLRVCPPLDISESVCMETIYQYVYVGAGRMGGFYKKLRRKQKVRQKRFERKVQKSRIPSRISIHDRPLQIGERKRYGDWETDSVLFSSQQSVLSVQVERKSRLCRLKKVANKTAEEHERSIQEHLSLLPPFFRKSITRDNGTENVLHTETKKLFHIPSYFCDTYSSWQKGGVENMNGLIREYLPRDCDFDSMSEKMIFEIQERLNNRPRKCLQYQKPNEIFASLLKQKRGIKFLNSSFGHRYGIIEHIILYSFNGMNQAIFKAYDIRGVYPSDINEEDVYAIGCAVVTYLKPKKIGIGRDIRPSSPTLFESFARGVMESGCDVINLGVISTPMVYFSAGHLDVDAVISLTASHNPIEYNGLKIALRGAIPVGEDSGLREIRDIALRGEWKKSDVSGTMTTYDIRPEYYAEFSSFAEFGEKKFTIAIDTANSMGVFELPMYEKFPENLNIVNLYNDLDHPFQCHEANPLKTETLDELCSKVKEVNADLGIAYDGDADRVGFTDETGTVIPMDLITGLVAKIILKKKPGATILYDLRSSRAVREVIEENGGTANECRVGHAFIKRQMRTDGAIFAGELSGHYYFEENSFAEASTLVAFLLLNLMAETGNRISELVSDLRRYSHSAEINSEVADKEAVLAKLKETYSDGTISELDGLKVDYADWWFNVRPSNTEPLLRLNVEAKTPEMMEEKQSELLALIRA